MTSDVDAVGRLTVGSMTFVVLPSGNNLVKIEAGKMKRDVSGFELSDAMDSLVLPVGQAVNGIEFLLTSDCKVRLTGMEIGWIILRYDNGSEERTPLVCGGNVDNPSLPFATQVERRVLTHDPVIDNPRHIAAFSVAANPKRVLREVEIRVFAADATLGLLAVNLVESNAKGKR